MLADLFFTASTRNLDDFDEAIVSFFEHTLFYMQKHKIDAAIQSLAI
jgi:hypothetical protein